MKGQLFLVLSLFCLQIQGNTSVIQQECWEEAGFERAPQACPYPSTDFCEGTPCEINICTYSTYREDDACRSYMAYLCCLYTSLDENVSKIDSCIVQGACQASVVAGTLFVLLFT